MLKKSYCFWNYRKCTLFYIKYCGFGLGLDLEASGPVYFVTAYYKYCELDKFLFEFIKYRQFNFQLEFFIFSF